MRALVSCTLIAASTALLACVKHYEPPAADEPHALVKLRRVFHSAPGPLRATRADVNRERVYTRDESSSLDAPQTDALRIHPGGASWEFAAEFHHMESRTVQETYYEQVPYIDTETYTEYQSYSCGFGTNARTCQRPTTRTRTVTKYRSEAKQRWVTKQERVVDDRCEARMQGVFAEGGVYILQYTYVGEGQCSITCLKQQPGAPGQDAATTPCTR